MAVIKSKDFPQIMLSELNGLWRGSLVFPVPGSHDVSVFHLRHWNCQELWRVYSFPYLLENKSAYHSIIDTGRRYETPGPETKNSLLITAIAAARVTTFVLVPEALTPVEQSNSGQLMPVHSVS